MVIKIKNVAIKFDVDNGRDRVIALEVDGTDFNDIKTQVETFADDYCVYKNYRSSEISLEEDVRGNIKDLFKVENPNADEQS